VSDTRPPERAASVPLGVARVNDAGTFTFVDARTVEISGYATEEMLGRHFTEFYAEEDRSRILANFEQRRLGIGGVAEYRLRRKNGTVLWVSLATVPTYDDGGGFLGVTGFVTDIDEQRRQQEFSAHERRLLSQIAGNYPLSSVLDGLCVTLETVSRRPLRAAVMLADGKMLKCVAAPNLPPNFRADRAAVCLDDDATPCAEAVRGGHEVIVGDATQVEAAPCLAYGFSAVWSYPVVQDGETLGTLALFLPVPGEPDAEDVRTIEFALQVARLALAHERKTVALQESERRFHDYVGLSVDWYWEQDADFRFTSMSGGIFNKGGFRIADSLGKTRWELPIEGVSETRWAEHRGLLERHEAFHDFTYTIRAADDSLRWYSVSGKPVFAANGEFLGYRGTSRDISAQKRAEDELRTSEQRFRDFAELSADWFWEQDAEFRFTEVVYGSGSRPAIPPYYDRGSVGKQRWELPYVNVPDGFWEQHRRLLQSGEPIVNLRLQRRDDNGELRHVEISGRALFDDLGRVIGYRGTGRDITEQIRSREKLEKTLHWLEQAVRAAGVGLWERDIGTWAFSFRDNWRALFGYSADEIRDTAEDFDRLVHPDDLARIHAAGRAYTEDPRREYEIRFRLRHKDGTWRWVLSRGNILNEAATGRRTFVGCHLDITEQMRNAEALQASEQRFRDYADMAADWFWEQDADFRYTHISGGIINKGSVRVADCLGKTRWELPIEGIDTAGWAAHRALLERHEAFHDFAYTIHAADGSLHWYSVSGQPVFDQVGRFEGYRGVGHDITERVVSRERLEKTQHWLEQAIRAGRIGLWERDADTWAFAITDNWKSLFGYAEDEIGNSSADFDRLVHPDDLERIHAFARAYRENPQGDYENRFRVRHKDGSWRWVLSRGNIRTDAVTERGTWVGCHIDITEQKLAEEALRANEGLLNEVLELLPVGVWLIDGTGNIVRGNAAGRRIWAGERHVGIEQYGEYKGWWLHNGQRIAADEWAAARAIMKGETSIDEEIEIESFDAARKIILNSAMPLRDSAGAICGGIIVNQDITARWHAENRVRELAAMLEARVRARTAELEEANRELDAFNFSVSHDLRTPLRAIEGFSRALQEDYREQLDAAGRDYLQRIGAATARMGDLIEALYELSRLSRAPLQLRPVDLSALARELVAELRELDPRRRVDIEIADTPPVEGDARLLRSVLANLLGNAWKFTAKVAPARIAFNAQCDREGCVVYSVVDNGTGFDMQFADKLFRIFHRLHRDDEFAGQGVGLTTVQRIITRHGGSVWGDGEKGRGASFCFTLWSDPALLAEAREAADSA